MSRLCPTKFIRVLSRDVGIKLNWVTMLNTSTLYILLNINLPKTPLHILKYTPYAINALVYLYFNKKQIKIISKGSHGPRPISLGLSRGTT
ncbi:hypothetical protein HanIR_Chr09g0393651 [Helianthus annuus]|nr:hypothetical protein HanIR_Chr09g0393651 [Helianthus annuus]